MRNIERSTPETSPRDVGFAEKEAVNIFEHAI